jgi:hypothetical protein
MHSQSANCSSAYHLMIVASLGTHWGGFGMAAGEIAAAVTGIRAALDIAKAMVGLRDAEVFRTKAIALQSVILDAFEKAIEAREAYTVQADSIRALEITFVSDRQAL